MMENMNWSLNQMTLHFHIIFISNLNLKKPSQQDR